MDRVSDIVRVQYEKYGDADSKNYFPLVYNGDAYDVNLDYVSCPWFMMGVLYKAEE